MASHFCYALEGGRSRKGKVDACFHRAFKKNPFPFFSSWLFLLPSDP